MGLPPRIASRHAVSRHPARGAATPPRTGRRVRRRTRGRVGDPRLRALRTGRAQGAGVPHRGCRSARGRGAFIAPRGVRVVSAGRRERARRPATRRGRRNLGGLLDRRIRDRSLRRTDRGHAHGARSVPRSGSRSRCSQPADRARRRVPPRGVPAGPAPGHPRAGAKRAGGPAGESGARRRHGRRAHRGGAGRHRRDGSRVRAQRRERGCGDRATTGGRGERCVRRDRGSGSST